MTDRSQSITATTRGFFLCSAHHADFGIVRTAQSLANGAGLRSQVCPGQDAMRRLQAHGLEIERSHRHEIVGMGQKTHQGPQSRPVGATETGVLVSAGSLKSQRRRDWRQREGLLGATPCPEASGSSMLGIMRSPCPGMDPFLETSGIWEDFQRRFLDVAAESLLARLPAGYDARMNEYSQLVNIAGDEPDQKRYPDVAATRKSTPASASTHIASTSRTLEPILLTR